MKTRSKIKWELFFVLFLVTFFMAGGLSYLIYLDTKGTRFEELRRSLVSIASSATLLIDEKDLAKIRTAEDTNLIAYQRTFQILDQFRQRYNLPNIYIMRKSENPNVYKFIIDASKVDENEDGVIASEENIALPGEEYDASDIPEMLEAFDGPIADRKINVDKWGWWLSGYAPIYDSDGTATAILGIDISAETIKQEQDKFAMRLLLLFVLSVVASLFVSFFVAEKTTTAIQKLVEGAERISQGNLDVPVIVKTKNELEVLAEVFNQMQADIKNMMTEIGKREAMAKELALASQIQHFLLPKVVPSHKNVAFAASISFASEMGGDYYDFFVLPNRIGVVISDVVGHGVPAALIMIMIRTMLKMAVPSVTSSAGIVSLVNRMLGGDIEADKYATMFYYYIDEEAKRLVFCNGGHQPALLFRERGVFELVTDGMPVGIEKKAIYREKAINLRQGDVVVLYTDGITEAKNPEREQFGTESLRQIIARNAMKSADQIAAEIINGVTRFTQGEKQDDDRTVVVMKVL